MAEFEGTHPVQCAIRLSESAQEAMPLSIWHLDRSWAVLEKPYGVRTVCGVGAGGDDAMESRLKKVFPPGGRSVGGLVTHRLDMETSGLLIIALTRNAHRALMRQFQNRKVGKQYIAVLDGEVDGESGTIELPLSRDPLHHVRQQVDVEGRAARTLWRVIDRESGRTRVEFRPETGRRHQIRIHAAEGLGCPIVGDSLYGDGADRMYLHASRLAFWEPHTGNWRQFASPPPF